MSQRGLSLFPSQKGPGRSTAPKSLLTSNLTCIGAGKFVTEMRDIGFV